jgi:hypothetical protein
MSPTDAAVVYVAHTSDTLPRPRKTTRGLTRTILLVGGCLTSNGTGQCPNRRSARAATGLWIGSWSSLERDRVAVLHKLADTRDRAEQPRLTFCSGRLPAVPDAAARHIARSSRTPAGCAFGTHVWASRHP